MCDVCDKHDGTQFTTKREEKIIFDQIEHIFPQTLKDR